jgi:hypothetical protein
MKAHKIDEPDSVKKFNSRTSNKYEILFVFALFVLCTIFAICKGEVFFFIIGFIFFATTW